MRWEDICRYADQLLFRSLMKNEQAGRVMERGIINGVDVDQMGKTIEAINSNPELAKFQFRLNNVWFTGGYSRSTIKGFYGAGQEHRVRHGRFVLEADQPISLLTEDRAANPVEYVLHALAACLTTSLVYHAGGAWGQSRRGRIETRGKS